MITNMGDSDEEYDRRKVGRDKFRRERSDYEMRGGNSGSSVVGRRDPYDDRVSSRTSDYAAQGGSGISGSASGLKKYGASGSYHDRRTPVGSGSGGYGEPPMKKSRRDWPEGSGSGGGYNESTKTAHQSGGGSGSNARDRDGGGGDSESRPRIMLSFKQFLYQQDDNITDEEAMQKYKEYKEDFARQQLLDFFSSHKEEEWFKEKYHPDYCDKRLKHHKDNVIRRKDVFMYLLTKGWVDGREVHVKETTNLVRLMNAVVIKLEGGSDDDLRILDMADADITFVSLASSAAAAALAAPSQGSSATADRGRVESEEAMDAGTRSGQSLDTEKRLKKGKNDSEEEQDGKSEKKQSRRRSSPQKPRKSRSSGGKYSEDDDDSGSGSDSDSGSASDDSYDRSSRGSSSSEEESGDEDVRNIKKRSRRSEKSGDGEPQDNEVESGEEDTDRKDTRNRKRSRKSSERSTTSVPVEEPKKTAFESEPVIDQDGEADEKVENEMETDENPEKPKDSVATDGEADEQIVKSDGSPTKETIEPLASAGSPVQKMPRPLHKTHSIFLRNLHPSITRQEIEGLCKAYPGFKRLALQDPAPERKFFRRGWVTFDRSVNIKEICWNLNNIRLKDCDLGAIVNRELTQRVRPVMVLANHKPVMRQDVKFAAKIVQKLDQKYDLWINEEPSNETKPSVISPPNAAGVDVSNPCSFNLLMSANPLMKNITEYLVDEGSYEEEALLGVGSDEAIGDDNSDGENRVIDKIEEDKELVRVLDRLVLYLRIVHSVDYYSCTEYPNEDEMPHRCGIIHARGAHIQPDKPLTQRDVEEYMKQFESKAAHLVEGTDVINEEAVKKLGVRDPDTAVEDFILANTQELAKDKWLCPLSGKKFKGPEFVRKHILNKHSEKLEEVRAQTEYFNHYLRDPKRPQLPEMRPSSGREERNSGSGNQSSNAFRSGSVSGATGGAHDRPGPGGDYPSRSQSGGYRGRSPSDRNVAGSSANDYYNASDYADYRGYGQVLDFYQGTARDFRSPPPPHGYTSRDYYSARVPYAQYSNFRRQQQYYAESMRRQAGGYGQRPQSFGGRRLMNYKDLDAPEETY